ncbi:High mobility group protein HMGA plant protein [Dioscorea alata]|uniref:High mobility group protein HMGA plant protein n=1 Tax=Dioscorea alata TaxID=55571 RepID=A0ACB7VXT0_DIOAL|nr:High mobility group protein HMGA plant protein [Dioscorea alata]
MAATDEPSDQAAFPSYSEMIMAAIDALNDGNGASESMISKFMEETYGGLPSTHSVDLQVELTRMKESGELVLGENYYKRPDAEVAPKRGRGRPPKAKISGTDGEAVAVAASIVPRPRGRPPKPKDPLAAAVAKAAHGLPKRRGRPPKNPRVAAAVVPVPPAAVVGVKRGRGRPPKVKPQLADVGFG